MDDHAPAAEPSASAPDADAPPAQSSTPDLGLLERVERELADVEAVLPRLDDGTYGTCEVCGERIPDERLASEPAARTCADHAPAPA